MKEQMSIKVGNAPVSWGVMEVAGWGEQVPYRKALDEITEAGYAGTELGLSVTFLRSRSS
jgi:inosose dehydratase